MTRVALYSEAPGAGVIGSSRCARRRGERVVVTAIEEDDRRQGRQMLCALVDQMLAGEFDVIVASLLPDHGELDADRLVRLSNTGPTE